MIQNNINMENYKSYIFDNICLILEKIKNINSGDNSSDDPFILGQKMAYYDIITILKEQAGLFDIDLKEIGLDNFNELDILL